MGLAEMTVKVLSPDVKEFKLTSTDDMFTAADYFLLSLLIVVFHFAVIFHVNSSFLLLVVPPAALVVARVLYRRSRVQEESLLVIRELGVQLQTRYYSGAVTHRFVDKKRIRAIVLNEAVKSYAVIFYMAFIVEPPPNDDAGRRRRPTSSAAASAAPTHVGAAASDAARTLRPADADRLVLVLAFENLLPKLHTLLPVYRASRAMMFGEPEE
eukprot:TRINITY_DN11838_c0_g1_i1.p2 TRINITY_DN11838_c0_g1~~TRINITY_DN11838_c0_g1_i1.p2  ORF type:complete len:212 (+),score=72.20 TRINITY_DN11838_c0_g1_i1:1177-1812(+)